MLSFVAYVGGWWVESATMFKHRSLAHFSDVACAVLKQTCLVRNVRVERRQDDDVGWRFGKNVCNGRILAKL